MNEWTTIRRRVLVEKVSKRCVCLEFGIGFRTLKKILTHASPPGYRRQAPREKPKLGPVLPVIDDVRLVVGTELVATHVRCWGKEEICFDPLHYLALLDRKPGALDFARPFADWHLPECFAHLRRRLEGELSSLDTWEYIKVLHLLEKATVRELTGAIEVVLSIGATSADAITLVLFHRSERPVGPFSLDGHPHLKSVAVEAIDLRAYDTLSKIGA